MTEEKYIQIIQDILNIPTCTMNDSVFEPKYGLSETDIYYLLYYLYTNKLCEEEQIVGLLLLDDITFSSLYHICN